ncbi:hypothetical protein DYH09_18055 [bacterium CPR1]|nr:hypothetical protein [bacterium CPR1]
MAGGGYDKNKLVQDFVTLLTAMEQAVVQNPAFSGAGPSNDGGWGGGGAAPSGRLGPGEYTEKREDSLSDSFTKYEELVLEDGRVLRRYENGSVRLENPTSGVIQEERIDGKLLVSLPNGKVIFQQFSGEPLLVYDTVGSAAPGLARVSSASLPGEEQPKFVYHFQDGEGAHLIELESLRYYRVGQGR